MPSRWPKLIFCCENVECVDQPLKVYNFTDEGDHTYSVGPYGLWMHDANDVCDLAGKVSKETVISRVEVNADHIAALRVNGVKCTPHNVLAMGKVLVDRLCFKKLEVVVPV